MKAKFDTNFETPILSQVAQAFQKRRKALKRKSNAFIVSRLEGNCSAHSFDELLIIELAVDLVHDGLTNRPRLQVKIWSDRWVSGVAFCRSNSGYDWTSEFGGRMIAGLSPMEFESDVERFWDGVISGLYRSSCESSAYWKRKLVAGPTGLVGQQCRA
jgi:hypothetical protein